MTLEHLSMLRKTKRTLIKLLDEFDGVKDPETRRMLKNSLNSINDEIRDYLETGNIKK